MPAAHDSMAAADRIDFTVSGPGAQWLFTQAAGQGIALRAIRCTGGGYAARAQGRDLARLRALAAAGGWQLNVTGRRGAGPWAERLLHRPGLAVGAVLCCVLLRVLAGFVFAVDLSALDGAQQQALRAQLAQNGIREGSWLPQAKLTAAQQELSLHAADYGWLSLNFAGGCLYVEMTGRERQNILTAPAGTALYARADGEVLAVEVDSGFAAVAPGQYVAKGQLLAAAVRPDHSGSPVTQAAGGRVVARVSASFTAARPLQERQTVLTGRRTQAVSLCLLGREWTLQMPAGEYAAAQTAESWQPLCLGRVALPASIHRAEYWEQTPAVLTYSEAAAAALARRACRLQLAEQFPDAQIETERAETAVRDGQAVCTVHYVFTADIAAARPDRGEMPP